LFKTKKPYTTKVSKKQLANPSLNQFKCTFGVAKALYLRIIQFIKGKALSLTDTEQELWLHGKQMQDAC
jgi:hypothetical protein